MINLAHARRVCTRINSMDNILWKAGSGLNADTHSNVFNAFVKPYVLYFATQWGNDAPTETAKMNAVLTHAARAMLRDPNVELNTYIFLYLRIRPLERLCFI